MLSNAYKVFLFISKAKLIYKNIMTRIEEVLTFLSSSDSVLRDEVLTLASLKEGGECQQVFKNVRRVMFPTCESERVQELCLEKGINTVADYSLLRQKMPELPVDPRPKNLRQMSWNEYLHPTGVQN
jgi:hypothetical protein